MVERGGRDVSHADYFPILVYHDSDSGEDTISEDEDLGQFPLAAPPASPPVYEEAGSGIDVVSQDESSQEEERPSFCVLSSSRSRSREEGNEEVAAAKKPWRSDGCDSG